MLLHRFLRKLAQWTLWSFFRDIYVVGEENVPKEGPAIVVCTHHNMLVDPAVLSTKFPYKRPLHFWSKASLFQNPVAAWVLKDTGNIPVDRKSKDNQVLFRGTFEALAKGGVIALFPEGTSYTEPCIMQVKDGASWSALEFTKWAKDNPTHRQPLVIVPAAVVYTEKAKYRSRVIMEFGKPITLEDFRDEFLREEPGSSRAAAKRLTARIEKELTILTINSPDWETLYCARMTRDLLWPSDTAINLVNFVEISQTLVDLFCTPASSLPSTFPALQRALLAYHSLLKATKLTNSTLSQLPLPDTLNPNQATSLPSRLTTLFVLIQDSFSTLIRLPFFFLPLIVHLPAYAMACVGANMVENEEETQAQNKIVFSFILLLGIYPAMFFFLWALFFLTPPGAIIALVTSCTFVYYHNKIVDSNYGRAKRLVAAWRVLLGVWMPRKFDLSLAALTDYTTPYIPPVSTFIDRPKLKSSTSRSSSSSSSSIPIPTRRRKGKIPTRRLIRHVLRARSDAAHLLANFLSELERNGGLVRASTHLAARFGDGGGQDNIRHTKEGVAEDVGPTAWRDAREVMAFLRKRGAKISEVGDRIEGDWAAASQSEGEAEASEAMEDNEDFDADLTWVPPKRFD